MASETIPKPLATVLSTVFARTASAREAVEHRFASLPSQEKLVEDWVTDLQGMAAKEYPGLAASSYPVQTRFSREVAKLKRYRSELPERIHLYARALKRMASVEADVNELVARTVFKGPMVTRPEPVRALVKNPWPSKWPIRQSEAEVAVIGRPSLPTIEHKVLPSPRMAEPTEFSIVVGGHKVDLTARYRDGVEYFVNEFETFITNTSSSRWCAIVEAVRCDIRWPRLDEYLLECPTPWFPSFYVDEQFGLRGSLANREALADVMAQLSPDSARWYLAQQPGGLALESIELLPSELGELVSAGLIHLGNSMALQEHLESVPFAEVKSLFILAGLSAPASYKVAISRFSEIRAIRDEAFLRTWLEELLDPSCFVQVREIPSLDREERLGSRARANVMVSSLVMLSDGTAEARQILEWGT